MDFENVTPSYLTAIGQVLALYKAHHGNTALEVASGGPEAPVLVTASKAAPDGSLVMTLANTSSDTAYQVAVELPGTPGLEVEEGVLLRGDGYLPNSVFTQVIAEVRAADGGTVEFGLPPMSVARVRARCGESCENEL